MSQPENIVLVLLREIRSEMATKKNLASVKSELKNDVAEVRSDVKLLRADVASVLLTLEKRLSDRIIYLNRALMEYHSSAVGHGMLSMNSKNVC
jgi:hypothetical protein